LPSQRGSGQDNRRHEHDLFRSTHREHSRKAEKSAGTGCRTDRQATAINLLSGLIPHGAGKIVKFKTLAANAGWQIRVMRQPLP
jgi:hypothetical protein